MYKVPLHNQEQSTSSFTCIAVCESEVCPDGHIGGRVAVKAGGVVKRKFWLTSQCKACNYRLSVNMFITCKCCVRSNFMLFKHKDSSLVYMLLRKPMRSEIFWGL